MSAAERLINRIREIINGPHHEATPEIHELAGQLQEACHSLNERLFNIQNFLRKGMRSEAVREAQAPPSVFELAETLNFKEWKKWQEFCLEIDLPTPPDLDLETVSSLKTECDKEQILEPLLQEFRHLVHTGSRDQKINILRQLRKQDPENPIWEENLTPLEEEQIEDLQEQAQAAIAEDEEKAVNDILQELKKPDRIVKPPSETVSQCENFLQKKREKKLAEESEKTSRQIDGKLTAGDYPGLEKALTSWQRLENTPGFKPAPEQRELANRARKQIASENERKRREEEAKKCRSQLQAELESSEPDPGALESLWRQLESLDEESGGKFKEPVQERLRDIREKAAAQHQRQALKKKAAAAIVIVILLAAGWFGYRFLLIQQAEREMRNLWQSEEYDELADYLRELEDKPGIFQAAGGESYHARLQEYFQEEEKRQSELAEQLEELQKMRQTDYPIEEEARIDELLEKARDLATTAEEQAAVKDHESAWAEHQQQRQSHRDQQFTRQYLIPTQERLEEIRETTDLSLTEKIEATESLFEQHRLAREKAEGISEDRLQELFELRQELNTWQQEIEEARTEHEARLQRKQAMAEALKESDGRIDQWENAIENYLAEFPNTALRTQLERAAVQAEWARDAKALADFTIPELPVTKNEAANIKERIPPLPAGDESVWHEALEKITSRRERLEQARNQLDDLRRLEFYDFKIIRLREHGKEEWNTYYVPGTIHQRTEETENGAISRYWGRVYGLHPESGRSETEHINVNEKTHEIEYSEREEENRMPLAEHLELLLLQVPDSEKLIEYLLDSFEELLNDDDFPLIPKAKAMEIIGQALAEGAVITSPGIESYADTFRGMNLDLPWYNHKNPAVQTAENRISDRLEEMESRRWTAEEIRFHRQLWKQSLNRGLRPTGILWPENRFKNEDGGGELRPVFFNSRYSAIWVIQENQEESAYEFYELKTEPGGSLEAAEIPPLAAGQLIFAPADDLTSEKVLEELEPPPDLKEISWPPCWPLNTRNLP